MKYLKTYENLFISETPSGEEVIEIARETTFDNIFNIIRHSILYFDFGNEILAYYFGYNHRIGKDLNIENIHKNLKSGDLVSLAELHNSQLDNFCERLGELYPSIYDIYVFKTSGLVGRESCKIPKKIKQQMKSVNYFSLSDIEKMRKSLIPSISTTDMEKVINIHDFIKENPNSKNHIFDIWKEFRSKEPGYVNKKYENLTK